MSFKDTVKQDIQNVFLNIGEFAEKHTIKFNEKIYEDIPVVIEGVTQTERAAKEYDRMQGIYSVTAKAYFSANDTDGAFPEQGKYFEIDDGEALGRTFFKRYTVVTAKDDMGMICLELEVLDE